MRKNIILLLFTVVKQLWIWIEINREKSGSTTIFAYLFTVITLIHPAATSKQHSIKSIRFAYEDFEEPLSMYDNHWVGKSQLVENKNWQLNHISRMRNCEIFETLIYTAKNAHIHRYTRESKNFSYQIRFHLFKYFISQSLRVI